MTQYITKVIEDVSSLETSNRKEPQFIVGQKQTDVDDERKEETVYLKDTSETSSTFKAPHSLNINTESAKLLESMFEAEYYETGIANKSEKFFRSWFTNDSTSAMNGLSKIFYENFGREGRKVNILLGVLHLLSHLKYEEVTPLGPVLAGWGTTHANNEVAEYSLKCFEDWENPEAISKLESMKFSSQWLQDYAEDIIAELKEESKNGIAS